MKSEQATSFTRRKFTITEELDKALQKIADKNYQGNISLCLRAAIEDHKMTLDGTDSDLIAQQLARRIDDIQARQDEIISALEAIEQDIDRHIIETESLPVTTIETTGVQNRILTSLRDSDEGLRIDDLADNLDTQTSEILPAIQSLIDRGLVRSDGGSSERFLLAGYTAENRRSEE